MLHFDETHLDKKISFKNVYKKYQKDVKTIARAVERNVAKGSEMTGWRDLSIMYNTQELKAMIKKAEQWQQMKIKNVVVIGIGGSYIGVKAAIDFVYANEPAPVNMIYIHNMSSNFIISQMNKLKNKKFGIIVISKSGTTLEPAIAFRLFRNQLINIVGIKSVNKYIVAITDKNKGTLHNYAKSRGYTMFSIPDNIGGRYSTITPVGLFPMLIAGLDISKIMRGAKQALVDLENYDLKQNSAYLYACIRHYLYVQKHLNLENFIVYDPSMYMLGSQWQQLFGESEGKNNKGLYPTYSLFTTDLHSLGQYLQQGTRNFFETTLYVSKPTSNMKLKINDNDDGLKYLNGKYLSDLTDKAFQGTINAHSKEAHVNNLIITLSKADEYHYGYFFMWLAHAAMMSAYLLKLNPFDQPGVESYKKNMFVLLGKK